MCLSLGKKIGQVGYLEFLFLSFSSGDKQVSQGQVWEVVETIAKVEVLHKLLKKMDENTKTRCNLLSSCTPVLQNNSFFINGFGYVKQ